MFRNPYADGLIILVVILLFFGPKRLPTLGRSLGEGLREFKDSITGSKKSEDDRPELSATAASPPVSAAPQPVPASQPAPEPQAAAQAPAGARPAADAESRS